MNMTFNRSNLCNLFVLSIMMLWTLGVCSLSYAQREKAGSKGATAKITAITVEYGATQSNMKQNWPKVGNQNWGCVKAEGEFMLVKVTTSPDNDATWNKIVWNGGKNNALSNNYRLYPRDSAAKLGIQPKIGKSGLLQLTLWVMWANVHINTSDVTPPNSAQFGTILDGTENLGAKSYRNGTYAAGKVAVVAQISPTGVGRVANTGWVLWRELKQTIFIDGSSFPRDTRLDWSPDDLNFQVMRLTPDVNDKIYDIDGPDVHGGGQGSSCLERYSIFRQFVSWGGVTASDTNPYPSSAKWYWRAKWKSGGQPEEVIFKDVGSGFITIPSTSQGCP